MATAAVLSHGATTGTNMKAHPNCCLPLVVLLHGLGILRVDAGADYKVAQLTQQCALLTQHHLTVRRNARPRRHRRQCLPRVVLDEAPDGLHRPMRFNMILAF